MIVRTRLHVGLALSILLFLTGSLTGCFMLPVSEVAAFSESTTQIKQTVASTGETAASQLAVIDLSSSESGATPLADEMRRNWQARNKALQALEKYSQGLVELVDSGEHGAESAKKLASSVTALAGSISTSFPGGGTAVEAVTKLAAAVYGEIAKNIAGETLARAIEREDPVIQQISSLMVQDLMQLKRLSKASRNKAKSDLIRNNTDIENGNARLKSLVSERNKLTNMSADAAKLTTYGQLIKNEVDSPWYIQYNAETKEIDDRYRVQDAVIDQTIVSLRAWALAHREIGKALDQKRAPSLTDFQQASLDLVAIYQTFRTKPK